MEEYLDQFLDEAYNDEILEFDKYFKENTLKTLIDSDDFEINDLIANFVKDQMVFNNHHIIRGNKEILLNFSNLNLVTKQDILDYAKEHPKLDEFLYSLIKEMYVENELNPHFDKSRSELLAELIELSDEEDFDIKYYLSNTFDYYALDPSYLDSYLDANELRSKLLKADLIKEHKINNIYTYKNNKMNTNKLRRIIRESVNDFIREIDEAGDTAAMEAKIAKCEEAIALREKKIEMSESLEEMKDLVDSSKINELKKEIKDLQKAKAKFEKAKEKKANKGKKKEIVTDSENPEITMEDMSDDVDLAADAVDNADAASLNESFIRMQKLAGIITESEYNEKIAEIEDQINEDNLEVKSIAKDLYQFLKKAGVHKVFLKADFKRQIGQRSGISSGGSLDNTAMIYYWDDEKTKQTLIQIVLFGDISKTKEVKDKLLSTYKNLEVIDQHEDDKSINFTVKEKTTAKGGLVGNTKTN